MTDQQRTCTKCSANQAVAREASVFVCVSCHAVNRTGETEPVIDSDKFVSLQRVNSSTFLPSSHLSTARYEAVTIPAVIAPCSICLDAPGDMIFLNCHHGGFCQACAVHIAGNNAVGGACCVKCRCPITQIVRIVELDKNNSVKAVEVKLLQIEDIKRNAPPKVPPPRGLHKTKKS